MQRKTEKHAKKIENSGKRFLYKFMTIIRDSHNNFFVLSVMVLRMLSAKEHLGFIESVCMHCQ